MSLLSQQVIVEGRAYLYAHITSRPETVSGADEEGVKRRD